ncbi:hypothetical protein [Legionella pneumophila]|uniref:hypothetical protein n=1 Tax=Legionella pneumophila TaxID=446 RepID=UPI001374E631|nr:hypothetical protein [Legionella pneumophila]HAT2149582.1 hypothetical protein [Legionella pneumophila]HAT8731023.1 hypothetical protein [Legionella pneumophila]
MSVINRKKIITIILGIACLFCSIHPVNSAPDFSNKPHVREKNKNLLGVFVGGNHAQNDEAFTYGFEYHRVLSMPFGFSAVIEHTPVNVEQNNQVELIGLGTLNVFRNLTFGIGPGIRYEKDEPNRMVGRLGIGYIIHFPPDIEITPNIDLDFIEGGEKELIFGITFGKQF